MSNGENRALERVLAEAFKRASTSRGKVGLPEREAEIRRTRAGGRWIGPRSYRVTLWLRPWEYVAVLDEMRRVRYPGGLNAYITSFFRPASASRTAKRRGSGNA